MRKRSVRHTSFGSVHLSLTVRWNAKDRLRLGQPDWWIWPVEGAKFLLNHLPLEDDTMSVRFWYQKEGRGMFLQLPSLDELDLR